MCGGACGLAGSFVHFVNDGGEKDVSVEVMERTIWLYLDVGDGVAASVPDELNKLRPFIVDNLCGPAI